MALDEAPPFWWEKPSWQAWLLSPFGFLYGRFAARNMHVKPGTLADVPVICVGNFITGGAGKTPTVAALIRYLKQNGWKPGVLSRGYGGGITEATIVEPERHNASDVGDEPLLHASYAMTAVSANRPNGCRLLIEKGCNIVVMDDGFQNRSLAKDFSLVVVDAKRGIGNGFTMPAGPLRVPLHHQLRHADAILVIGEGTMADRPIRLAARAGLPIFQSRLSLIGKTRWANKKVLAFAGIADPDKFYQSLDEIGVKIIDRQSFGDHHLFTGEDCQDLLERAQRQNLQLITTTKDKVRLIRMGADQMELAGATQTITVELIPEDPSFFKRIVDTASSRFDARRLERPAT